MQTGFLYHRFGINGYQYVRKGYQKDFSDLCKYFPIKNTNKLSATFFSFEDRKKHFQKMVDILDKLIDNQRYSTEKMTFNYTKISAQYI